MNKEKWVSDIEKSLDNITKKATLRPDIKAKIIQDLSKSSKVVSIGSKFKWAIAASFALLLSANLYVGLNYENNQMVEEDAISEFIDTYELIPNSITSEYSS